MHAGGLKRGGADARSGRGPWPRFIEGRTAEAVDDWLDSLDALAMRDRRNGSYSRYLLTELGDIKLSAPRTRRLCPTEVLRRHARRAPEIERVVLVGSVLGLSTRNMGEAPVGAIPARRRAIRDSSSSAQV